MRNRTTYEWVCETLDAEGEIVECHYTTTLAECLQLATAGDDLGLVQRIGNDDDGELERAYAYVQPAAGRPGRELPEYFDNGARVPQRFHAELSRVAELSA